MRKSDGSYTYFVPDVAYHLAKFERGFTKAINIQGTDHHGTIARVRAGLQAADAGVPPRYPDYVLNTMVRVERGGEEVKISKRAGNYVTLRDLIEWTSRDAVRFFMLQPEGRHRVHLRRRPGAQAERREPGLLRAVRARAHLLGARAVRAQGGDAGALADADLAPLAAPSETALLQQARRLPGDARRAPRRRWRRTRSRSTCASSRRAFHSYYGAERFLVDDPELARARLALLAATRQIIRNALAVLGVGAPERMDRETDTA